jgi:lipid A 4'-phosphatase
MVSRRMWCVMAIVKHNIVFLVTLIPIAIFTLLFYLFDWDVAIAGQFWNSTDEWFLGDLQPWVFFEEYLDIPIVVVAVVALVLFFGSFFVPTLKHFRWELFFIAIVVGVGDGVIVNLILKTYWGRPRPREVLQFGGALQYVPLWSFGTGGDNSSFTCGHCAAAWSFIVFGFLFLHRSRLKAALAFIAVGVYGTLMSITRMVQGAHFFSDAMWSLFIMYIVAFAFYYWILKIPARSTVAKS